MNFSPFGGHFTGIHQFVSTSSAGAASVSPLDNRYAHPHHHPHPSAHHAAPSSAHHQVSSSSVGGGGGAAVNIPHFGQSHSQLLGKLRAPSAATSSSSSAAAAEESHMNKYNGHPPTSSAGAASANQQHYGGVQYSQDEQQQQQQHGSKHVRGNHGMMAAQVNGNNAAAAAAYHQGNVGQELGQDTKRILQNVSSSNASSWQAPSSTVADYLSHLPASTLPLSLHHFLKYSAETIKKESAHSIMPVSGCEISE